MEKEKLKEPVAPEAEMKGQQYTENEIVKKIVETMVTTFAQITNHDTCAEAHG